MSYETPIKLAMTMERIMVQAREEQDKKIYQAVLDSGIKVSRDELIKALKYDRDQYVKGYEDGKADAMQWIPCSERLPDDFGLYLASYMDYTGYHVNLLVFDPKEHFDVDFWKEEIDAWMPLPPAYKEGDKE